MITCRGRTKRNTLSEHCLEATAERVYLAVEFDFDLYERNLDGSPKRDGQGNQSKPNSRLSSMAGSAPISPLLTPAQPYTGV
jgi:hypothetical protein